MWGPHFCSKYKEVREKFRGNEETCGGSFSQPRPCAGLLNVGNNRKYFYIKYYLHFTVHFGEFS